MLRVSCQCSQRNALLTSLQTCPAGRPLARRARGRNGGATGMRRRAPFDPRGGVAGPRPEYDALRDPSLAAYFACGPRRRCLLQSGLVDSRGRLVDAARHAGAVAALERRLDRIEADRTQALREAAVERQRQRRRAARELEEEAKRQAREAARAQRRRRAVERREELGLPPPQAIQPPASRRANPCKQQQQQQRQQTARPRPQSAKPAASARRERRTGARVAARPRPETARVCRAKKETAQAVAALEEQGVVGWDVLLTAQPLSLTGEPAAAEEDSAEAVLRDLRDAMLALSSVPEASIEGGAVMVRLREAAAACEAELKQRVTAEGDGGAVADGWSQRRRVATSEERAATRIQATFRGHRARRRERDLYEDAAASIIQASIRGHLTRARLHAGRLHAH